MFNILEGCAQEILEIYYPRFTDVFIHDIKLLSKPFPPNYSDLSRLPPLVRLTLTSCFNLFSFVLSFTLQAPFSNGEPLLLYWQFSLVYFSSQLLTHFPLWYSVGMEGNEGKMERVSCWVWACLHLWMQVYIERTDYYSCKKKDL